MTDRPLLARLADPADPAAMAELVRRHGPMVLAAARRLAPHDADDVAQAVFVLLGRRAGDLRHRDSVAGWLYEATRLCAKDARRAAARHQRQLRHLQETHMPPAPGPHAGPEWAAELDYALGRLPDPDRHVVLLRYLQGLTVNEAAERLNVSPAAVAKRASRAVERLRDVFRARGHNLPVEQIANALALQALPLSAGDVAHLTTPTAAGPAAALADQAGRVLTLGKLKLAAAAGLAVLGTAGVATFVVIASRPVGPTPPVAPPGSAMVTPAAPGMPGAPVAAPEVAAAPDSFEAAEQTADAFLRAVRDNDLVAARRYTPPEGEPGTLAEAVAAMRRPYAAYPDRLIQRVGTMKSQDMNGRPLAVAVETVPPFDASIERVTLRLTPRPAGVGWVVAECGLQAASPGPLPANPEDAPRIGVRDKAAARRALDAWNAWFEPARSFAKDTPTEADLPRLVAAFRNMRGGLGPMLAALKGTEFEKPADTQRRAEAVMDAMIAESETRGLAAFLQTEKAARFKDNQVLADLWNLGPQIAARADAEADDETAKPRPPAVSPDRSLGTVGGRAVTAPGPLVVPAWLRAGGAWKRWLQTKDVRAFATNDDAGNRYVVNVNGFTRAAADGPAVESIGAIRMFRPDGTLAAVTEHHFGGGLREWQTLDATGKRVTCRVRLRSRTDPDGPEAVDTAYWYEPDGNGRRIDFTTDGRPREVLIDPVGNETKTITPRY